MPKQVQVQNTDSQVVVSFPALPFEALDCISCWNLLEGEQQSDLNVGAPAGVPRVLLLRAENSVLVIDQFSPNGRGCNQE